MMLRVLGNVFNSVFWIVNPKLSLFSPFYALQTVAGLCGWRCGSVERSLYLIAIEFGPDL